MKSFSSHLAVLSAPGLNILNTERFMWLNTPHQVLLGLNVFTHQNRREVHAEAESDEAAECAASPLPRPVDEPGLLSSDFIPPVMTERICIEVKTAEAASRVR